jgi:IS30 family transposase
VREGIDVTPEDLERSEAIIRAGIENGQGIDHIFFAHKGELAFSESSFYRHVKAGNVSILPIELRKAVKYKLRNKSDSPTRTNIPAEVLLGRTYADFLELSEEERARVVECDCVEGPNDEVNALLTMHFKALHFQIAFKLEVKDTAHVLKCFKWLYAILKDSFGLYFSILLFDRGSEFAGVLDIEALSKGDIRTFFCDPQRSDQKASAEKNHVEVRKVIEKGASLKGIDMWVLSEVMSHVNSSLRHSTFGISPMELAMAILPKKLLDHLGYRLIAPDDVVLLPKLLKSIKRPSQ